VRLSFELLTLSVFADRGVMYTLKVLARDDLVRQLVKSSSCTITIPEFQLTIPPGKGQITTVEGILRDTITDLRADQPLRRIQDERAYAVIEKLLKSLSTIIADTDSEGEQLSDGIREEYRRTRLEQSIDRFTFTVDDPSGDSFLEFRDSTADPQWTMRQYNRTREQNELLGLQTSEVGKEENTEGRLAEESTVEAKETVLRGNEEIFVFPGVCSSCGRPLDTMMKKVVIPYFKVKSFLCT
jgi:zinc finger protein